MINLDIASNTNERLALAVFKAMEDSTLLEALDTLCTEDFVWMNSGLPTLQGTQAVRDLMARGGFRTEIPILAEQTHFTADVMHLASRGDVVFTERVDHHWAEDGRDLMTPHIAGVIEIRDGRICALRDFYDVACYTQQPTQAYPEHTLREHRARTQGETT